MGVGFDLAFWAVTFDFLGKILLVGMALLVHRRVLHQHKINKKVLRELRLEQSVAVLAFIFLITGYVLHLML